MDIGQVGRIALGVGAGIGAAAVLAACANDNDDSPQVEREREPAPRDPVRNAGPSRPSRAPRPQQSAAAFVRETFEGFDANGRGGITSGELTRAWRNGSISGPRELVRRDANFNYWQQDVGHRMSTYSMRDAFAAARNLGTRDRVASWAELTKLAARFDLDGLPGLSNTEQRAFDRRFGVEHVGTRRVWTGTETWRTERYPDRPGGGHTSPGDDGGHTSPGDDNGSTSPGDDNGWPGNGGGTSPGDDGGGWPGNGGGTSSGDDGGTGGGGSGGSGNSSDNGNPNEDDF